MKWCTLERRDDIHVLPCDESGEILEGHTLDASCMCGPSVEELQRTLVIHNEDIPCETRKH